MRGFAAIGSFAGRSSLSTWLTRIAINEALGRARAAQRRRKRLDATSVVDLNDYRDSLMRGSMQGGKPDADMARGQIRAMMERSEEHTSELQSLMCISYADFCMKKKNNTHS